MFRGAPGMSHTPAGQPDMQKFGDVQFPNLSHVGEAAVGFRLSTRGGRTRTLGENRQRQVDGGAVALGDRRVPNLRRPAPDLLPGAAAESGMQVVNNGFAPVREPRRALPVAAQSIKQPTKSREQDTA